MKKTDENTRIRSLLTATLSSTAKEQLSFQAASFSWQRKALAKKYILKKVLDEICCANVYSATVGSSRE